LIDPTGQRHLLDLLRPGFIRRTSPNGSVETTQFDALGRCCFKHIVRSNGTIWTRRYCWSGEGELTCVQDSARGEIRHAYDPAHRLCGRNVGESSEDYVLDEADNLLQQPGLSGVVLRDGNRLAEANGATFIYDDRNHIRSVRSRDSPTEYAYDSRDMLVRAETGGETWTASYDAQGRRTRKTWRGATTEFYWYGDQLMAEVGPSGAARIYVYPDPLALTPLFFVDYDSVAAGPETGRVYTIITDQLGTPIAVEDVAGAEVWSANISPYGQADIGAGSRIALALRFPGHYADAELGLHYNRFRHYSPMLGRYLQSDPWGIAGGSNLYAYPRNPLLTADVRGLGEEETSPPRPPEDDAEGLSAGARLARERGMPEPPPGYHYVDIGGEPRIRSNPGSENPAIMLNPNTNEFQPRPAEDNYRRASFDADERQQVFDQSRGPDGVVRCPCGEPVASPAAGDMDMGHKPEHQFAPARDQAIADGTPPSEFNAEQHNLNNYRAEHPGCNRSHQHESEE
jgi:RHS repeat-associated protein